jgi:hypothetical protein
MAGQNFVCAFCKQHETVQRKRWGIQNGVLVEVNFTIRFAQDHTLDENGEEVVRECLCMACNVGEGLEMKYNHTHEDYEYYRLTSAGRVRVYLQEDEDDKDVEDAEDTEDTDIGGGGVDDDDVGRRADV